MVTPQVPTIGRPPRAQTKHPGILAPAVVFALLVVAAITVWQRTGGQEAVAPTPEAAVPTTPAPAVPVVASPPAPSVYLVGSAEEADRLRAAIAEADVLRAHLGEVAQESTVLLVATPEGEAVLHMLAEQDAIRDQLGLPPLRFVDLRAQPASTERAGTTGMTEPDAAAVPASTAAEATPPTLVYLVGTEAAAADLRASEPGAVVIVWGTEQADQLLRSINDFEPSNLRLVDRRFAPTMTGGAPPAEVSYDMPHLTP